VQESFRYGQAAAQAGEEGRRLLAALAPGLPAEVAAAVLGLAGGDPAVLREVAGTLTAEQIRGTEPPPCTLPAASVLGRRCRAALAALPGRTRGALLLAAADPDLTPGELLAATSLDLTPGELLAATSPDLTQGKLPTATDGDLTPGELLAATSGDLTPGELPAAGAAENLGIAEQAGLITVARDAVRFVPAVLRAVVYYDAPLARRRAAHSLLAEVLRQRGERLRGLVHRAAATVGTDDELARELVAAAADGPARTASAAYRWVAELTTGPGAAGALVAAARQAWLAGERQQAGLLLRRASRHPAVGIPADRGAGETVRTPAGRGAGETVRAPAGRGAGEMVRGSAGPDAGRGPVGRSAGEMVRAPAGRLDGEMVRALAGRLAGEMELREGDPDIARDLLLDAAARLVPDDVPAALEALLLAGEAVHRAGRHGRYREVARRVLALRRGDEPPPGALAYQQVAGLDGMYAGRHDLAFARLRGVLRCADRVDEPAALIRAAGAGVLVGDDRRARALAGRAAAVARDRGEVTLVPQALEVVAFAGLAAGHHEAATAAATEGAALARATGQPVLAQSHFGVLAVLAALVGDRESCVLRVREAGAQDVGEARALCQWALALLDLVEGRPRRTVERLGALVLSASGRGNPIMQVAATPHLVEAVWRCDPPSLSAAPDAALDLAFEPFDRWTAGTGQPAWLALRSRCRAMRAAEPRTAEEHFREALRQHRRGDADFARAHTELLFGRDLRRRRRPGAAREHLGSAVETFRLLGAGPWAAQADEELRAAGAPVPPDPAGARELTAQQERIARLVADGATNREIAQRLFLSPRTIDHHLRNVFARLGVRSRTELALRLAR
jgi:DNA-binding CsgD family transcriptional regulator